MGKPFFSIIMPAYNAEKVIRVSVESVLNQDFRDFELIIVDDGSNDNTRRIAEEYADKDWRVRVISQPNGGASSARNHGMMCAEGQYYMFLDSDDRYHIDYLASVFKNMQSDEQLTIVGFDLYKSGKQFQTISYISGTKHRISITEYLRQMLQYHDQAYWGANWNKVYCAEIIKANGLKFQDQISIGEDLYFNLCYLRFVQNIRVIHDGLYDYEADTVDSLSKQKRTAAAYCKQYAIITEAYEVLCEPYASEIEKYRSMRDRFIKIAAWDAAWVGFMNNRADWKQLKVINDQIRQSFPTLYTKPCGMRSITIIDLFACVVFSEHNVFSWTLMWIVYLKRLAMRSIRRMIGNV